MSIPVIAAAALAAVLFVSGCGSKKYDGLNLGKDNYRIMKTVHDPLLGRSSCAFAIYKNNNLCAGKEFKPDGAEEELVCGDVRVAVRNCAVVKNSAGVPVYEDK